MKAGSFREVLKKELEQRSTRNSKYSLRSFARDLDMAPALLSDVLNGKKGLSRITAAKVSDRLGFTAEERSYFCDLVESQHARSKVCREQASARLSRVFKKSDFKVFQLDQVRFSPIMNWYHMAILELMKTPEYEDSEEYVSKRLGITRLQSRQALERMEKFGLVARVNGKRYPTNQSIATPDGVSSADLKQHHEQFIKLGLEALFTQSVQDRDIRGLTIQCSKNDVPLVRERIKKFLIGLDQELSKTSGDGSEVYQLNTQFFCLTRPIDRKKVDS